MRRTLSLEKDFYLASHRLHGTPCLPMAMLIELLCERLPEATWATMDELVCRHAIFLRKGRDRTVLVDREQHVGTVRVRVFADDEWTYAEGSVRLSSASERPGLWRRRQSKGRASRPKWLGKALYRGLLPHGPHFQSDWAVDGLDPTRFSCRVSGFDERIEFMPGRRLGDLRSHPAALDAAIQACAVHHAFVTGRLAVPVRAEAIDLNIAALPRQRELACEVERLDSARYRVTLAGYGGAVVASFGAIDFVPAGQPLDTEVIGGLCERIKV